MAKVVFCIQFCTTITIDWRGVNGVHLRNEWWTMKNEEGNMKLQMSNDVPENRFHSVHFIYSTHKSSHDAIFKKKRFRQKWKLQRYIVNFVGSRWRWEYRFQNWIFKIKWFWIIPSNNPFIVMSSIPYTIRGLNNRCYLRCEWFFLLVGAMLMSRHYSWVLTYFKFCHYITAHWHQYGTVTWKHALCSSLRFSCKAFWTQMSTWNVRLRG